MKILRVKVIVGTTALGFVNIEAAMEFLKTMYDAVLFVDESDLPPVSILQYLE